MADVTAERNESEVEASKFSIITEDILMNIFSKLEEDPRHLASLACVCSRFNSIIRSICWKRKCMRVIPAVVADLLQANGRADRLAEPPGGWSALQKLAVCCPGLCHAGIPLENYDLGLERVIGPSHQYKVETRWTVPTRTICSEGTSDSYSAYPWTIYDDMNFHVEYEAELGFALNPREEGFSGIGNGGFAENPNGNIAHIPNRAPENPVGGDTGNGVGENPVGGDTGNGVGENPVEGDTGNGVGENPNGQIAKKSHRDAENSIGEMGEGFLANPCAVTENPIGDIADNADPIGEIEDNAAPIGSTENPNGENRNITNKLNRVVRNPIGETGNGITQNPNRQIIDNIYTIRANRIGKTDESCKGNPCAVTECPNGEIADDPVPIGGTKKPNGESRTSANKLNQVAENLIGETGNGITLKPNGQIPDRPNRVAEIPIGQIGESCKGNLSAVTEWPRGEIAVNADPTGEIADNTDPIGGAEKSNEENMNIADKLNRVADNLIGEMGNGITHNPNGQIPDKPNRVAENQTGVMVESCKGNPCAVTECLNGEIADNANLIEKIAGVEGKTSEFSMSHDNPSGAAHNPQEVTCNSRDPIELKRKENPSCDQAGDHKYCDAKKQKKDNLAEPHLASDIWNLTREQGNKLLASRFRGDSLYMCDWPGCVHSEGKRIYRVFRGIFKNFRNSYVWRNINDTKAKKSSVNCAFCSSMGTWDMLATFCLRRTVEYYDDGEPSIRAYVCENGHVAGAWTDRPMYK